MAAPLDGPEFERWLAAADRAVQAAEVQAQASFAEWACFLAEQSAQLALKGLLHGVGAPAWGHDLAALERTAATTIGVAWPPTAARRAERLSRFYIPTRYPDAVPGDIPGHRFDAEDAAAALADARAILGAVRQTWQHLSEPPAP